MGKSKGKIDFYTLFAVLALVLIGILTLASAAAVYSQRERGLASYFFYHQLIYGFGAGLVLGLIAYKTPLSFIKKISFYLIIFNLFLMLLPFVPGVGLSLNGASRWINLRSSTLQPAEPLKLVFIIYLAAWLAGFSGKGEGKKAKKHWKVTLAPFLIILGLILGLLYLQSDGSTLMVIFAVSMFMYFLAETPVWHIFLMGGLGAVGLFFLIAFTPYRMDRFTTMMQSWKDPFLIKDPMGVGYQIKQALIAVGSGGLFGVGLGMSHQKAGQFLPHIMSDSIFTVFAEETGFIGSVILLFLFVFLFWRCVRIGQESKDTFSRLFCVGAGAWLCLQPFINIGSMIGILPLAGIPIPFMSYGGSHVLTEFIAIGMILNISKHRNA